MKKIKFSTDEGTAFYKELIEEVDKYFKTNSIERTGNNTMIFKIILYFTLDILFYYLMINAGTAVEFYGFYLLMGLSVLLTAFNVSHDASHGVAVKSKRINDLLFQISFNLQGNNAYVWGKNHTESHHLYTNIEGSDIDVLNNPLVRMTRNQKHRSIHRWQHLYVPFLYFFYSLNWFFFRETLMMFGVTSRTIQVTMPKSEIAKLIFFKLLYIGFMIMIPAVVLPFSYATVISAFFLNHFLVSVIFTAVLGVSHLSDKVIHPVPDENGLINMSWAKLQLKTSIDYSVDSAFCNWTLGGFNAHAVHHLLPSVCHVHYRVLIPVFRELCKKHGLNYMEMSYSSAVTEHFRFLKKMGTDESEQMISTHAQA
jgi:linoleoyl-CoA desaturase